MEGARLVNRPMSAAAAASALVIVDGATTIPNSNSKTIVFHERSTRVRSSIKIPARPTANFFLPEQYSSFDPLSKPRELSSEDRVVCTLRWSERISRKTKNACYSYQLDLLSTSPGAPDFFRYLLGQCLQDPWGYQAEPGFYCWASLQPPATRNDLMVYNSRAMVPVKVREGEQTCRLPARTEPELIANTLESKHRIHSARARGRRKKGDKLEPGSILRRLIALQRGTTLNNESIQCQQIEDIPH
ncbi:unnamed protein product [Nesidiocoris tenuis]|uniref:Uncharacterized protein n=1 Tax=Nesidiocoris tenuis TaxID=355587 RepID=A0A6H5GR48_9HEMI|nr:unnamed protein product [Nesidiocoris tenuis]